MPPTPRPHGVESGRTPTKEPAIDVAAEDGVLPGDERVYRVWYRDPVISPCGTGSNFSSALRVTWG